MAQVNTVSGVLSQISEKPWTDRESGKDIVLYSFTLEGSRKWYRTGTNPVPFGRGTPVKFVVRGQNVDVSSMERVEAEDVPAPAPARSSQRSTGSTQTRSGGSQSRDGYWANKEARDLEKDKRYQEVSEPRMAMSTSVTAAAQVVTAALENNALSFGNVKAAEKKGLLVKFVKEIATELAEFIHDAPETLKSRTSGTEAGDSGMEEDDLA